MRHHTQGLIVALATALLPSPGSAAPEAADRAADTAPPEAGAERGFLFRQIEAQGRTYHYAVYVPRDLDLASPAPFIVFLHGRGECGTEGTRQIAQGLPLQAMFTPEAWPFVILLPQKPDGESQWPDHDDALMAMIDATRREWPVDDDRTYLTGLSQGGYGTWHVGAAHADMFAAIAPVCGYIHFPFTRGVASFDASDGVARSLADRLKGVPTWIFHGDADDVVPPLNSSVMFDAMRAAGADVRLSMYEGVNHGSWGPAYREASLPAWLLSHRLSTRTARDE